MLARATELAKLLPALLMLALGAAARAGDAPAVFSEVAPLLQRCQHCHRPGQIGPVPLRTYEELRPFGPAIREAVAARRMPPWFADPRYGDFRGDPSFTDEEIERIVSWIDAGAKRGDPADEPAPLAFESDWTIAEPDLVLTMPSAVELGAGGEDRLERVVLETGLQQDRWIRAVAHKSNAPRPL